MSPDIFETESGRNHTGAVLDVCTYGRRVSVMGQVVAYMWSKIAWFGSRSEAPLRLHSSEDLQQCNARYMSEIQVQTYRICARPCAPYHAYDNKSESELQGANPMGYAAYRMPVLYKASNHR